MKKMRTLATKYEKLVQDEIKTDAETLAIENVGKQDPKKHLKDSVDSMMACSDACGNSIATVKEFGPISSVLDEEAVALTSDIEGNLTGERGGPLAGNLSILSFSA